MNFTTRSMTVWKEGPIKQYEGSGPDIETAICTAFLNYLESQKGNV